VGNLTGIYIFKNRSQINFIFKINNFLKRHGIILNENGTGHTHMKSSRDLLFNCMRNAVKNKNKPENQRGKAWFHSIIYERLNIIVVWEGYMRNTETRGA